jgi:hypothetical protein
MSGDGVSGGREGAESRGRATISGVEESRATFRFEETRCPARVLDRHVSRWISMFPVSDGGWDNTSRLLPKSERNRHWIDIGFVPPRALVTLPVKLAMMDPA